MELIPGLPNDIARLCVSRVPYTQFSTLSTLSRAWKSEIQSLEFWSQRKQLCNNKEQLVLFKCRRNFIYKLIVVEPETNNWYELPLIPDFPNGLNSTFHFVIASFRCGFVVMGVSRKDYECNKPFCNKVFVFDYRSAKWHRGADMPEGRLSVYRCTSDHDRMIYVLCSQVGRTECIMVYDVLKDEWTSRINTGKHGGLCNGGIMEKMIHQSGKIHFFDDGIEEGNGEDNRVLDVTTWKWEVAEKTFTNPYGYQICSSDEGEWYSCRRGRLLTYKDSTWKEIEQVPKEKGEATGVVITWKRKLMVILTRYTTEQWSQFKARVLDLKNNKWTTLDRPKEFKGIVEEGCYLEI